MHRIRSSVAGAAVFASLAFAAERWNVQFFHDEDQSSLELRDIQCPSPERCVAAGIIQDLKGHSKGTAVVTSDGGAHWSYIELKDLPVSLFFLNDANGWMVTDKSIWFTDEAGRTWKKLKSLKGIERVWFQTPTHGWAVGYPKAIYETVDGGAEWTKVEAAQTPTATPEETDYTSIAFSGDRGMITGNWLPGQHQGLPVWIDPANQRRNRPRQSTTIFLQTVNGGKNWTLLNRTGDGYIGRVRLGPANEIFALFEFPDRTGAPSGLYQIDPQSRKAASLFEQPGLAVRDVAILPDGDLLLAAIELPGRSSQIPIPGKLKVFRSHDRRSWREMPVDYRATATRPVLAVAGDKAWLSTDTGMILKLTQ